MRIGFDATALPHQITGAGNYIIQVLRELALLNAASDSGDSIVIFAQQHSYEQIGIAPSAGVEWVLLADRPPAQRLIWEQIGFPASLRRARIDLLHSPHYTRPFNLPCKSVVTFHDMTFFLFPHLHTPAKRLFFPLAIRASARLADQVLASSESTRQDIIRILKIDARKVRTVHLGVSPAYRPVTDPQKLASVRSRYQLPEHFILYVGVVEPRKNLPLLIQAYRLLVERGMQAPLVIAGKMGWMYAEFLRQLQTLQIQEKVHLAGYIPAEDLPIVYNLADVFVYPSIYEGFGLPPLEAMACGTPVITSAVSSMPEHVGEAGMLVAPQDELALADAIQRVFNDPDLRRSLSQKGPPQAAQFTWKKTAQETMQIYRQILTPVKI